MKLLDRVLWVTVVAATLGCNVVATVAERLTDETEEDEDEDEDEEEEEEEEEEERRRARKRKRDDKPTAEPAPPPADPIATPAVAPVAAADSTGIPECDHFLTVLVRCSPQMAEPAEKMRESFRQAAQYPQARASILDTCVEQTKTLAGHCPAAAADAPPPAPAEPPPVESPPTTPPPPALSGRPFSARKPTANP